MDKFWALLKESVITQAAITLILICAVAYLACTGQEIPEIVQALAGLVVGYYFGSKVQAKISTKKEVV